MVYNPEIYNWAFLLFSSWNYGLIDDEDIAVWFLFSFYVLLFVFLCI